MKQFITQLLILLATLAFVGCERGGDNTATEYGYVQFKLVKAATMDATRTTTPLDKLGDAKKIEVGVCEMPFGHDMPKGEICPLGAICPSGVKIPQFSSQP